MDLNNLFITTQFSMGYPYYFSCRVHEENMKVLIFPMIILNLTTFFLVSFHCSSTGDFSSHFEKDKDVHLNYITQNISE